MVAFFRSLIIARLVFYFLKFERANLYFIIIMEAPKPKFNMKRYSKTQQIILVEFMERNMDLVRNKFGPTFTTKTRQMLWEKLMDHLNAEGGTKKNVAQWQKTWSDMKRLCKIRARDLKNSRQKTGGGTREAPDLTDIEERILALIGPEATFGIPSKESTVSRTPTLPASDNEEEIFNVSNMTETTMTASEAYDNSSEAGPSQQPLLQGDSDGNMTDDNMTDDEADENVINLKKGYRHKARKPPTTNVTVDSSSSEAYIQAQNNIANGIFYLGDCINAAMEELKQFREMMMSELQSSARNQ